MIQTRTCSDADIQDDTNVEVTILVNNNEVNMDSEMYAMMMSNNISDKQSMALKIISFNMHGFQQGCSVIDDLIEQEQPDIFMLQEHWLTP